MNHLPYGQARRYGSPLIQHLFGYAQMLASKDLQAATVQGNAILQAAAQGGASQDVLNELQQYLANAIQTLAAAESAKSCSSGGAGTNYDAIEVSDDHVDWYEPDPNRFYVLDQRSGRELADVLEDLRHRDVYIEREADPPTRQLFIGGPGTGKTTGALWLGSQLGLPVAAFRIDGIVSSLAGKTAKNVRAAFKQAEERECVVLIDELEAIAVNRGDSSPNTPFWDRQTTSALLELLDNLNPTQIVIGATNVPDQIDSAIRRRLREHVHFHNPDRDARAAMVARWWRKAPHVSAAKRRLLDLTEGQSGDFLERAAKKANRTAARRGRTEQVTVEDVERAVEPMLVAAQSYLESPKPESPKPTATAPEPSTDPYPPAEVVP